MRLRGRVILLVSVGIQCLGNFCNKRKKKVRGGGMIENAQHFSFPTAFCFTYCLHCLFWHAGRLEWMIPSPRAPQHWLMWCVDVSVLFFFCSLMSLFAKKGVFLDGHFGYVWLWVACAVNSCWSDCVADNATFNCWWACDLHCGYLLCQISVDGQ